MAIKGVRNSMQTDIKASGARTGLIWLLNNGTATLESHRNVGPGNQSSALVGKCLAADGDRTDTRKQFPIPNDRVLAS